MESLTRWLMYDDYMRHIDMCYNKINQNSLKEFINKLKNGKSLVSLELRGNPGYSDSVQKKAALLLLRNVNYCKENKKVVKPMWLKKDIFDIDIPEGMLERINPEVQMMNNSININTMSPNTNANQDIFDKIDVSLEPK